MTPKELDEARAKEAVRIWSSERLPSGEVSAPATIAARLAREGWTPPEPEPEPVDPDVLAFREWVCLWFPRCKNDIKAGWWDHKLEGQAYLAGARMAREQERERAKVLDQAKAIIDQHARLLARLPLGLRAEIGIEWQTMMDATASFYAKYRGEA